MIFNVNNNKLKKSIKKKIKKFIKNKNQRNKIYLLLFFLLIAMFYLSSFSEIEKAPKEERALSENGLIKKVGQIILPDFILNKRESSQGNSNEVAGSKVKKSTIDTKKFSRITFFLSSPITGSLAIPEDWEGKYKLTEDEKTAYFLYNKTEEEKSIFIFKLFSKNEWENVKKGDNLLKTAQETGDFVFAYKIYPISGEDDEALVKIKGEAEEVIESFKSYQQ